jgi:hypothetical protein
LADGTVGETRWNLTAYKAVGLDLEAEAKAVFFFRLNLMMPGG